MQGFRKIIVSCYSTAAIFVLMAVYLIRGKYFGGELDPRVMLVFAGLLILQCVSVLGVRLRQLKYFEDLHPPRKAFENRTAFPGQPAEAMSILAGAGFTTLNGVPETSPVCYDKRVKSALCIELVAYGALLFTLVCGTLNFGLGIRGYLMAAPGIVWMDMASNLQKVQQGFLADNSALAIKMKVNDLKNADSGNMAQISFDIANGAGKGPNTCTLKRGDAIDIGKLRLRFLGDTYMVFSYVTKNGLDFQSEPVYLHPDAKRREYVTALKMNQPGTTGEIVYDPESTGFKAMIYENGKLGFDQTFKQGEVAKQGKYAVQVTGLGHFGRIDVMRHNYRNQIFAGLFILAGALVVRLFCRPLMVWLWLEDDRTMFYTRDRRLRKLLLEFQRGS
ncbi:MAG: hypothetical protein CXR31_13840 [Geobacter sp.]|nr:MAG: hypothetical protein CXR31_13840 [Geobacter sp.]